MTHTQTTRIWNVPFARNEFFVGRDELLSSVRKSFDDSRENAHIQVVHGLGGMGKTQFALEYAYRFRSDYQIIWWLTADEPTSLALSYAGLAEALGMKFPPGASLDGIRHELRRELGKRNDFLLIFDNAPGPQDIRHYLPLTPAGHVLITSRNPVWGEMGHAFSLRPLERAHSMQLLRQRSGRMEAEAETNRLAQALNDLPLALDQAGACIEQTQQSFSQYLSSFENHWGELLQRGRPSADYPETAAMVLELSLRQVEEISSAGTNLMKLCAFLAVDEIPFTLLREAAPVMNNPVSRVCMDPVKLDRAVSSLMRFSLLETNSSGITIHRLVAAIARDRMSLEERSKWARVALRAVGNFKFDSADVFSWGRTGMAVPHILATVSHARKLQVDLSVCAELLNDAGRYLHKRAEYKQAQKVLEESLELHRDVFGHAHPKVAGVANNLGRVLKDMGRDLDAITMFEQALTLDQGAYGNADPHVATIVNNYGIVMRNTGDFTTARQQFEWALQIYEKHYGPEHARTASALNNLGFILKDQGYLPDALEHFKQAATSAEAALGPNHPTVACILHNIAEVLRAQGQPNMAIDYAKRALQITEAAHGPVHPEVARDLVNVADCEVGLNRSAEAREKLVRALTILRGILGDSHLRTMSLRKRLESLS